MSPTDQNWIDHIAGHLAPLQAELEELELQKERCRQEIAHCEERASVLRKILRPLQPAEEKPVAAPKRNGSRLGGKVSTERRRQIEQAVLDYGRGVVDYGRSEFTARQIAAAFHLHLPTVRFVIEDMREKELVRLTRVAKAEGQKSGRPSPHYAVIEEAN